MSDSASFPPHISASGYRLLRDLATEEVMQGLRESGIRSILLKGPSIARWLYAEDETRMYSDTDLLVQPADVDKAQAFLASVGFTFSDPPIIPGDRPHHAYAWTRHSDKAAVDLHRTIIGVHVDPPRLWEVLSQRTEWIRLRRVDVEVLDVPARCVQIALHAAHHGADVPHPIEDLKRAIARSPKDVWREAADVAAELGALSAFCEGLRLIPQGVALLEALAVTAPETVESVLRADGTPGALGLQWLVEQHSFKSRLRLLIRKAIPPPDYIRDWWPPARRDPLSLVVGYVRRVLFLIRQLMPAMRALRRARRKAARTPPPPGA